MAKEKIKIMSSTMVEKYDGDLNLVEVHKSKVPSKDEKDEKDTKNDSKKNA